MIQQFTKKWKKHAAVAAVLAIFWMWLQTQWNLSNAVLGMGLGFIISVLAYKLAPLNMRIRTLRKAGRLFLCVCKDMIQSNIDVCKAIWRKNPEALQPGFVEIPLSLRDPHALSVLACIITYTPGTVWVDLSEDYVLTIHVLDLIHADEWKQFIKQRYELPLKEIFE